GSNGFPDGLQRTQGFCGRFSRKQYGEVLSGRTEDLPIRTSGQNSGCNQFENLFAYRLPVNIGILSQLVDADDCDGESFAELRDCFVISQATGNTGEFVAIGPLIEG